MRFSDAFGKEKNQNSSKRTVALCNTTTERHLLHLTTPPYCIQPNDSIELISTYFNSRHKLREKYEI